MLCAILYKCFNLTEKVIRNIHHAKKNDHCNITLYSEIYAIMYQYSIITNAYILMKNNIILSLYYILYMHSRLHINVQL